MLCSFAVAVVWSIVLDLGFVSSFSCRSFASLLSKSFAEVMFNTNIIGAISTAQRYVN